MSGAGGPTRRIFAVPVILAAISGFGLVAALLSNAPADWLWDACIAVPLVIVSVVLLRGTGRDR